MMLESDGPGGAESVILTLSDGLKRRGIEVMPVVFRAEQDWMSCQLKEAGFSVYQPQLRRPIDPAFVWELTRWLRGHEITHIHAHEFTMGFYAGAAGAIAGVPHTLTMHGGVGFAAATRRRLALALTARRASAVVGVSESTCEHLARALWMPRERVQLVPNGIRQRNGERVATRSALQVADDEILIVAVGNLYEVKGHRTLVEAAARLTMKADLPRWRIAIAGRGDQYEPLLAQIASHGLQHRVHLLGLRDDVPDLLAAADGWVMPSLSEGLPMALLEAMFARLPVVCSAVGGIPGLVEHGKSGWLVTAGDAVALAEALEESIVDPERRVRYGNYGFALADKGYGQMTMVDRYLDLYRWRSQ